MSKKGEKVCQKMSNVEKGGKAVAKNVKCQKNWEKVCQKMSNVEKIGKRCVKKMSNVEKGGKGVPKKCQMSKKGEKVCQKNVKPGWKTRMRNNPTAVSNT
jgi:hypothetical protein